MTIFALIVWGVVWFQAGVLFNDWLRDRDLAGEEQQS